MWAGWFALGGENLVLATALLAVVSVLVEDEALLARAVVSPNCISASKNRKEHRVDLDFDPGIVP